MALTTSGSIEPQRNSQATADAARVYGVPGEIPDKTRMAREAGTAVVAAQHTSTPTAESSYADGAFTLGKATRTAGKASGAAVPGTAGFPGDTNWPPPAA